MVDGAIIFSILIRSVAKWVSVSVKGVPEILMFSEKNYTVSSLGSTLVLEVRIYNTGSNQLPVLCTILLTHTVPMCAFCWGFHLI